jgi:hypothetical protein
MNKVYGKRKYKANTYTPNLCPKLKQNRDAPLFCKGLVKVNDDLFLSMLFRMESEHSFWEDIWLGDTHLSHQCPSLYNIVQ